MAARSATTADEASANERIFAVEVEPGVFVYSLPLPHTMPAETRKMLDEMDAQAAERIDRGWAEVRRRIAARRNGEGH